MRVASNVIEYRVSDCQQIRTKPHSGERNPLWGAHCQQVIGTFPTTTPAGFCQICCLITGITAEQSTDWLRSSLRLPQPFPKRPNSADLQVWPKPLTFMSLYLSCPATSRGLGRMYLLGAAIHCWLISLGISKSLSEIQQALLS